MGKAVSKDGWLTNAAELIPFAGFITAPIHAAGGNAKEAVKAVVGGLVSGTSAVMGLGVASSTIAAVVSSATV